MIFQLQHLFHICNLHFLSSLTSIFTEPFGEVQNVKDELNGKYLVLSWEDVPLDKQGGFILGYKVQIFHYDSNTTVKTMMTKSKFSSCFFLKRRVYIQLNIVFFLDHTVHLTLDPGSYTINISAFTSAGEGVNATLHRRIEKDCMCKDIFILLLP